MELAAKDALERKLKDFAFRNARPKETPWQLTVTAMMVTERTDDADGGAMNPDIVRRSVGLTMTLVPLKTGKEPEYATDVLVVRTMAKKERFEGIAEEATKQAMENIAAAIALQEGTPKEVVKALSNEDLRIRARAVSIAGERQLKEAVPRLMEMVQDEEEEREVVLKVIGALVAIDDPSAVTALIDAGRRRSSAYVTQILFAVAQLGGKQAEAYLFTVSSGHPDPALRQAAKDALAELERNRSKKTQVGEKESRDPSLPQKELE